MLVSGLCQGCRKEQERAAEAYRRIRDMRVQHFARGALPLGDEEDE